MRMPNDGEGIEFLQRIAGNPDSQVTPDLNDPEVISARNQESMSRVAKLVGVYYTGLIAAGVPEKLSARMAEEFHSQYWGNHYHPCGAQVEDDE